MPKITFDEQEIDVPSGITVLQAARLAGVEIPVFCYHERLDIAGNCRMCLVEMQGSPKPIASCAMPVNEGMIIRTKTPMVAKARTGVLEFLLMNHPLDCPICDQGGECDLQDITVSYGCGIGRCDEDKRAVPPKHMGPLVKTEMNRCIHCTRCIRFMEDVAGVPELAAAGRGEDMEIQSYADGSLTSELSGNIIDLCPVGALTSRPYAFKGRPWELTKTESIDVMDALGSAIRVDTAYGRVQRILPRLNEDINEEWLSDKSRFSCDGLSVQRLDQPYVRDETGRLRPATWEEATACIGERLAEVPGTRMAALCGDLVDVHAQMALLDLMRALGSPHTDCRQDGAYLDPACRASYTFNTTLAGVDTATHCLVIAADLRTQAPLLAARLRKRFSSGELGVSYLGTPLAPHKELTFPVQNLGDDPKVLDDILSGAHPLGEILKNNPQTMIILGQDALTRPDAPALVARVRHICETYNLVRPDWCGFNVLHKAAARVGGMDVGFVPGVGGWSTSFILKAAERGDLDVVYLLGADEIDMKRLGKTFIIYQGHHGDQGAAHAHVVLPGLAYTEKDALYVNTEGRIQRAYQALKGPGDALEDWRIIARLAGTLGKPLAYDTWEGLGERLIRAHPAFGERNTLWQGEWTAFGDDKAPLEATPFGKPFQSAYMSDPISRASATMAACIQTIENVALSGTKGALHV